LPYTPPPTTEPYLLSLHDALPICRLYRRRSGKQKAHQRGDFRRGEKIGQHASRVPCELCAPSGARGLSATAPEAAGENRAHGARSEEHTSELQSRENLVCRLLLEK